MRLSDHLAKSTWALIDKGLPVIYGFAMIFIVIRILPKEEYGVFVIVQALFYLILNLSQHSLTRPLIKVVSADVKNADWAISIVSYAMCGVFFIGLVVITLLSDFLGNLLNVADFGSYIRILWLLSLSFIPKTIIIPYLGARIRTFHIFLLNFIYFIGSFLGVIYLWSANNLDLASDIFYINIIAASLSSLFGVFLVRKTLSLISWKIAWDKIKELTFFGKYTFGYGLSRVAYQQADTYIIAAMMGPVEVAIYNAAKIFLRFYNVISQAISTLVFPVISRLMVKNRTEDVKQVYEKGTCFYSMILFPVNILFLIFAKYIFLLAYGDKYPGAVLVFQILVAGTFFHPLASIGNSAVLGLNKPNYQFILKLITSIINIGINLLLIPVFKSAGAAFAVSITLALDGIILYFLIRKLIPVSLKGILFRTKDTYRFGVRLIQNRAFPEK